MYARMGDILANLLREKADLLELGNSKINAETCHKILNCLNMLENGDELFSKREAADYVGMCISDFDYNIKYGQLPAGEAMHDGLKALFWWKSDLDMYLEKYGRRNRNTK